VTTALAPSREVGNPTAVDSVESQWVEFHHIVVGRGTQQLAHWKGPLR